MTKRLPFRTFKSIYTKVPRACVDLVITDTHGVLLTKRSIPPKNLWHLPGGTILMDETPHEAVHRVAQEELGVKIKIIKLLEIIDYKNYLGLGHPIGLAYLATITQGAPKPNSQASALKYFKTPPSKMIKQQKEFFQKYLL